VPLLLLVGAPGHERGAAEQESEHVGRQRRLGAAELLEEDRRLDQRRAPAAVLDRPVHARPPALLQAALPVAAPREVAFLGGRLVSGRVRLEPVAQLVAERALLVGEGQVHVTPLGWGLPPARPCPAPAGPTRRSRGR